MFLVHDILWPMPIAFGCQRMLLDQGRAHAICSAGSTSAAMLVSWHGACTTQQEHCRQMNPHDYKIQHNFSETCTRIHAGLSPVHAIITCDNAPGTRTARYLRGAPQKPFRQDNALRTGNYFLHSRTSHPIPVPVSETCMRG